MVKKNIHYFSSEVFVENVSNKILELFQALALKKDIVTIALSGGSTPIPIFKKLAAYDINWEKFQFFLVDERCVPIDSDESNFGNLHKAFFSKISAKSFSMVKENTSFLDCAKDYEKLLLQIVEISDNEIPTFDVIFLGMGNDGHTASLFPETEGLKEHNKLVFLNKVPQLNTYRITFSYPLLFNAKEIIVLASGVKKCEIIEEIYATSTNNYPISKIAYEHKNLNWYISP